MVSRGELKRPSAQIEHCDLWNASDNTDIAKLFKDMQYGDKATNLQFRVVLSYHCNDTMLSVNVKYYFETIYYLAFYGHTQHSIPCLNQAYENCKILSNIK